MSLHEYEPPRLKKLTQEEIDRLTDDQKLRLVVGDYDRRRASAWGRFLLWLLRKTT